MNQPIDNGKLTFGKLLSFIDPQANKERLTNVGVYQPQGQQPMRPPMQPAPPSQQGGFSMGSPQGAGLPPVSQSPTKGSPSNPRYNQAFVSQAMQFYIDQGKSPEFAAGMVANALVESGGDPEAFNKEEGAFGLFQHRFDRLDNLKAYAERQGMSANDIGAQLSFSLHELQTFERSAYDKIFKDGTPQDAATYAALIDQHYERSSGAHRDKRVNLARTIYSDFTGGEISPYTGQPSGTGGMTPTSNGNRLSFGAQLGATDPMNVDQGMSMGSNNAGDLLLQGVLENYKEKMNMGTVPALDPAIVSQMVTEAGQAQRFAPAPETAQESYLSSMDDPANFAATMSMGTGGSAATSPTPSAQGAGGGEGGTPPPAPDEQQETAFGGPVERFLNTMFNTDAEDMNDDERRDRRRAMTLALQQGFQMLSRGTPMDLQPIVGQRMELQQMRRASDELKKNAGGMSEMLIAAGMPELAQLPFMGERGMETAMSTLANVATRAPADQPFNLSPQMRSTMAASLQEMGRPDLGEMILTSEPGEGLKQLYGAALGVDPPKAGEAVTYTPEVIQQVQQGMREAGLPESAVSMFQYADDKTKGELIRDFTKTETDAVTAANVGAAQAGVDTAVERNSSENIANAFSALGDENLANVARAAGSGKDAMTAIQEFDKQAARKEAADSIKQRGEAVAGLIPDDMPNAEELRNVARNAQTSEDLTRVYEQITQDERLKPNDQRLYDLAQADPGFLKFLTQMKLAETGTDPSTSLPQRIFKQELDFRVTKFIEGIPARAGIQRDMSLIKQIASSPNFNSGKLEAEFLIPAQRYLTSIFGEEAPDIVNDETMTGGKLVELIQNANFAQMTGALKGAISDKETTFIRDTLPSIGDERTQLLAVAQYHDSIVDIQEAEYNAMLEYMEQAPDGKALDRNAMLSYVNEKTKDMSVFTQVPIEDAADYVTPEKLMSGELELGDVFVVVGNDGTISYQIVGE